MTTSISKWHETALRPSFGWQPPMGPHALFGCHTGWLSTARDPHWSFLHARLLQPEHLFMCVCGLYLCESGCPQRVEPLLWLNNALCICDQVIYMRCDRMPPSRPPGPLPAGLRPGYTSPGHSALLCPRISNASLDLCPGSLRHAGPGCCRSFCRWLKHEDMLMLEGIDGVEKDIWFPVVSNREKKANPHI